MKKMKPCLALLMVLAMLFVTACAALEQKAPADEPAAEKTSVTKEEAADKEEEKAEKEEAVDDPLTLTKEERAKGTAMYFPLGAKYAMPQAFRDNANYVSRRHRGFDPGVSGFVKFSREQFFRFDGKDEERVKAYEDRDIQYTDFPLFGVFLLNKKDIPEDESEMLEFLGFPHLELLREEDEIIQYFAYGDKDLAPVEKLDEADKKIYEELLASVDEVRQELYAFHPMSLDESIGSVKNWTFESQFLDGTPADQSIFSDKEVTLVSYMTTWCPHCVNELPAFQEATETFLKEKNAQILAIYADLVPDETADDPKYEETKKTAEELLAGVEASFPAIEDSYSVQNSLSKYAMNYPTNFFVDHEGNVLMVHVGAFEDLEKAFDDALKLARGEELEDETAMLPALSEETIQKIKTDPELTLTEEEKDQGYDIYAVVGAKFRLPESYQGVFLPYRRRHRGFGSTPEDLIRMSREYFYKPDGEDSDERYVDYPLFALFVLNKAQVPENEADLISELGFQNLEKTYEDEVTVQYFAKGDHHPVGLNEKELEVYESLFNGIQEVEESLYTFPALDLNSSIGTTKNWRFKTENRAGEAVDQEAFKNKKLTLVSYMTTWCPHCVKEIPVLEEAVKKHAEDFQVLYVIVDHNLDTTPQEDQKRAEENLKMIFEGQDCDARILFNNNTIEDSIGKFAMNFPTNFFMDESGTVVGQVVVGGFNEESIEAAIQERLELLEEK